MPGIIVHATGSFIMSSSDLDDLPNYDLISSISEVDVVDDIYD